MSRQTCLEDGVLQAYLDQELTLPERKRVGDHLQECSSCACRLKELEELQEWEKRHLLLEEGEDGECDVELSWQRFLHSLGELPAESQPPQAKRASQPVRGRRRRMKKWIPAAAAALLLIGGFSVPGVREAAADMLQVFRVQNLESVRMTTEELDRIAHELESKVGSLDLRDYGEAEVIRASRVGPTVTAHESPEAYAQATQGMPALPDTLTEGAVASYWEQGELKVRFALDVKNVNRLITALGGKTLLPAGLDGEPFLFTYPAQRQINWYWEDEQGAGSKEYSLVVGLPPSVETSADAQIEVIQQAMMDLPFLSAHVKRQLEERHRFLNTLAMPELLEAGEEMIALSGTEAILRSHGKYTHELIWMERGYVVQLSGHGMERDAFVEAARQVQWP